MLDTNVSMFLVISDDLDATTTPVLCVRVEDASCELSCHEAADHESLKYRVAMSDAAVELWLPVGGECVSGG
jgi:hypothetical protein